jgi:hypothetical protein
VPKVRRGRKLRRWGNLATVRTEERHLHLSLRENLKRKKMEMADEVRIGMVGGVSALTVVGGYLSIKL